MNEKDLNLVAQLTNQAIPTATDELIKVTDVTQHISWQQDTLVYKTLWANQQEIPLVLRTYRSPLTYWQTQDPHKLKRVWAVLRRLRLDDYPSPRVLAQGNVDRFNYIIWHWVSGEVWSTANNHITPLPRPPIPQLADVLMKLHTLNHNGLNNEPLYQATIAGTLVRLLVWSREMDNPSIKQTIARLKPTVAKIKSWPHRLIHGNPHFGNVLLQQNKITALINWENAAIGDPRWDVMMAAYWLRDYNTDWADQLINWYETFTSKTIDERPFWYALISVRRWALKAWLDHAIKHNIVPQACVAWTTDLPQAKQKALQDLDEARL